MRLYRAIYSHIGPYEGYLVGRALVGTPLLLALYLHSVVPTVGPDVQPLSKWDRVPKVRVPLMQ